MTKRDRIVVLVAVGALALGAFFMLVLKPKRDEAAKLATQVSTAQKRVEEAQGALVAGQRARATYAANYATVARLGKAVPTDDDIPSLVYQLDTTAESTGVDFRSVKLTSGAGNGPQATSAAAAAAQTSDQANSGDKSGESKDGQAKEGESKDGAATPTGTTASPAAPTQTAAAALPPGAVVGEAGLSKMPFSFSFEGDFFRLSKFLTRLERYIKPQRDDVAVRGRLLLVDGIALTASQSGFPTMKASIAASAYLLPADQGLFDGATPEGPSAATGTPGQPVSDGGASSGAAPTPPAMVSP